MKILKLLNKKYLVVIFFVILNSLSYSNEPVDIWKLEPKKLEDKSSNIKKDEILINSNKDQQLQKINEIKIQEDETLLSKKIEIVGLYDPEKNGLTIDMWSNSDGAKIIEILNKIQKVELSRDAKEILNILLLTNSYFPQVNISKEKFLDLKSEWLIKDANLELIEEYLVKNQKITNNEKLIKFLVNEHLSNSKLEKSCDIFSQITEIIKDDYLSKFNIYCLVNKNKRDQAQLQFDLKKEIGFSDKFFEKKFDFLMGYEKNIDSDISEKTILDFHLSHRTNSEFKFQPDKSTPKNIWKYLSTSNLLDNIESIDLEDQNKISLVEKATHAKNYKEEELYNLYKRFQFNIDQLLSVKESYKLLSNVESRALLYQGILITSEIEAKLELIEILKDSFIKEDISNAFNEELIGILNKIKKEDVPSNYTSFYNYYTNQKDLDLTKIKINNKILHQSKLLNYFSQNESVKNTEKDLNDLLKKVKKDKNYFISLKDIILLESLKSDGVKFSKKYNDLYTVDESNIPDDIQLFINNDEIGLALLRLVQIIGQDELKDIGPETTYFIINALNQLNIDPLRNKILLKILPLKV